MTVNPSPFQSLHSQISAGDTNPSAIAQLALDRANSNAGHNVYLTRDPKWTLAEATSLPQRFTGEIPRPLLYGLPVSLKDCFDLAGFRTTCGSRFYADFDGVAKTDSWIAEKLRNLGAMITGKTHLHQLAYGITGENPEYGDCTQPRNPAWLTGGSSSGAAASIQEGSAVMAIGTDTGGSIRVPAALCGIAGYRSSLGLGSWRGGAHLAQSFDTLGFLFADLRDGAAFAQALFDLPPALWPDQQRARIGVVNSAFLHDCEPEILQSFQAFAESIHADTKHPVDTGFWEEAFPVFRAIQAHEAARIHAGHFANFETSIRERLEWGASIPATEIEACRLRHSEFRGQMNRVFREYDFLITPCAPVSHLLANVDQSSARARILRYTSPGSLAGIPIVAVPLQNGGVQLMGRHGDDSKLLVYAKTIGERLVTAS